MGKKRRQMYNSVEEMIADVNQSDSEAQRIKVRYRKRGSMKEITTKFTHDQFLDDDAFGKYLHRQDTGKDGQLNTPKVNIRYANKRGEMLSNPLTAFKPIANSIYKAGDVIDSHMRLNTGGSQSHHTDDENDIWREIM